MMKKYMELLQEINSKIISMIILKIKNHLKLKLNRNKIFKNLKVEVNLILIINNTRTINKRLNKNQIQFQKNKVKFQIVTINNQIMQKKYKILIIYNLKIKKMRQSKNNLLVIKKNHAIIEIKKIMNNIISEDIHTKNYNRQMKKNKFIKK